jgi:D-alanyl-D-alanine carboxypeptidase
VLGDRNMHMHLPIASTTKIMTGLIALQLGHLDDRIVVPKAAFNFEPDATVMGLRPGETVTLRDLLYGLMLPSGADAANTIAIHYGGSEAAFVDRMNREAHALGMYDTHYVNSHGLTAPHAYSSAYDLAILGQYVSFLPDMQSIMSTREYRWNGHTLINLNKVLYWYPGLDGVKPGFTDDAGICQVLDARRDGRHIIVVLLHTPNLDIDSRNALNFGLQDFTWVTSNYPGDNPSFGQSGTDSGGSYVYYPGSGHYVRGMFQNAFRAMGGLQALGLPRTEILAIGRSRIQYFQNGALQQISSGKVVRLPLGLTSVPVKNPTPRPTTTPTPFATQVPQTPIEGQIPTKGSKQAPHKQSRTPTPKPRPTRTPTPSPPPPAGRTPTPVARPAGIAGVFVRFQQKHRSLLGPVAGSAHLTRGYTTQLFSYGALVYDPAFRQVYLLPLGDRLLAARNYLPAHPGNAYPPDFARTSILRTIGWL